MDGIGYERIREALFAGGILRRIKRMAQITLSNGAIAIVDESALPLLTPLRWHQDTYGYPYYNLPRNGGDQVHVRMHRLILNGTKGVDHINMDKLDNRRCNLRRANPSQNAKNRKPYGNTPLKGVWRDNSVKRAKPFKASIARNGRHCHIGWFTNAEDAARAYDDAARAHGLDGFEQLNFP